MDLKILIGKYKKAIVQLLDDVAIDKGYNNQQDVINHVNSCHLDLLNDSKTYVQWCENVWQEALFIMNELLSGERSAPGVEQFLSELPVIDW